MKIAVISDIHANLPALETFFENEQFDQLLLLGDVVGYGPNPAECLGKIMGSFDLDTQGNHDYALANNAPIRCREDYRDLAEATMAWTRTVVSGEPLLYLQYMPTKTYHDADRRSFCMVHGSPADPLYKYLDGEADEEELLQEISGEDADTFLVGHSHMPFIRQVGDKMIINPGSIGMPRDGVPEISYAIIEGGDPLIVRHPYDIERTLDGVAKMEVADEVEAQLVHIYKTATDPT